VDIITVIVGRTIAGFCGHDENFRMFELSRTDKGA
jgi:hypothetical protein